MLTIPKIIAETARIASLGNDCDRLRVGAVVWRFSPNGIPIILSTGCNRAPRGSRLNCRDHGHLMVQGHCIRTSHAEQVALSSIRGGAEGFFIHITHTPCPHCIKQIIEEGILAVTWSIDYGNTEGTEAVLNESKLVWGRVKEC